MLRLSQLTQKSRYSFSLSNPVMLRKARMSPPPTIPDLLANAEWIKGSLVNLIREVKSNEFSSFKFEN